MTDPDDAQEWLQRAEGVIAKEIGAPYRPGERVGMVKIKRVRTIDAVVMGWRPGKEEGTVGSFILGLLRARRAAAAGRATPPASRAKEKRELPAKLAPYETGERGMGDPSRWANDRELEWIELRPELVVEVTFDHTSNDRIRHGAKIARWREDKAPPSAGGPAGPVGRPDGDRCIRPRAGCPAELRRSGVDADRAVISSPCVRHACSRSYRSRASMTSL